MTDGQGLELECLRTCEVRPRPEWDSMVQSLHLQNRLNLRLSELPVLESVLPRSTGGRFWNRDNGMIRSVWDWTLRGASWRRTRNERNFCLAMDAPFIQPKNPVPDRLRRHPGESPPRSGFVQQVEVATVCIWRSALPGR
jgi:hypothetical protein